MEIIIIWVEFCSGEKATSPAILGRTLGSQPHREHASTQFSLCLYVVHVVLALARFLPKTTKMYFKPLEVSV
jgi:hypothetical protein